MNKAVRITVPKSPSYEKDGYGWAMAQAKLLREGRFEEIDLENIIEEIECVGKRERSEYGSHLIRILTHMIKWEVQPERRGMSWWLSIVNGRDEAERCLLENPSLKSFLPEIHGNATKYARRKARTETGLPDAVINAVEISYEDAISRDIPRPEGEV
jgi:Domain of unknown function DUF29